MHINVTSKLECCGCTACALVCGKSAIAMKPDVLGFVYPVVDESLCVDCGKCVDVCQFHPNYKKYSDIAKLEVYGVRHKQEEELQYSQSGGASWAIIQTFLDTGGAVYGAAFDTALYIKHQRVTSIEDAVKFRGSKYVQSNVEGIFLSVREDLKKGIKVLFFGTGCQIAGLKASIPLRWQEDLLTVDLVCHATPSPAVWKAYVEYLQKKYKSDVKYAAFRDKRFGWHSHIETIKLNEFDRPLERISFRKLFYDHVIVRPSCTECPFTCTQRVSDLTIADFWGWEKHYTEWNDNKGVNLLFINTIKGKDFFEQLKSRVLYVESSMDKCLQPQLQGPISADLNTMQSASAVFERGGYKALAYKYGDLNPVFRAKTALGAFLRKIKILK